MKVLLGGLVCLATGEDNRKVSGLRDGGPPGPILK
jgi:hypothetical protein